MPEHARHGHPMLRLAMAAAFTLACQPLHAQGNPQGGPEGAPEGGNGGPGRGAPNGPRGYGEPSDIISADIAFSRLVQDKGQWNAFRATAAPDARILPVDGSAPALAESYAKGRPNPPAGIRFDTHAVWISCDGSVGVADGAWNAGDTAHGQYLTIWQRQRKGGYKWVLTQETPLAQPLPAPDWVDGKVADCPLRAKRGGPGPNGAPPGPPSPRGRDDGKHKPQAPEDRKDAEDKAPTDYLSGHSRDNTLSWSTTLASDGSRQFSLMLKISGQMREVLHRAFPPAR